VAEHGTKQWQPGNDRPEECVPLKEINKLNSKRKSRSKMSKKNDENKY